MTVPGERESLFATRQWFDIWAEAFGGRRFGWWSDADQSPAAVVPYVRSRERIAGMPFAMACSAQNFHSPSYDVIGGRGASFDLDRMLADVDVSMAAFHGVSVHSAVWAAAGRVDPRRVHVEPMEEAPFVDCTIGWDRYWAERGKNLRANCEGTHRRLGKSAVNVLALSAHEDVCAYRDVVYEIEASGWKGQRGTAMAQTAATRAFYDRLLAEFSHRDLLRLYLLEIDGQVIAFELCTLHAGVLTGLKCGYRESHGKLSPGQYLRYRFLQSAFASPEVELYNMLGPISDTKRRWSTGAEQLWSVRVFRRSPGGRLALAGRQATLRLKDGLRRLVRRPAAPPSEGA